MQGPRREPEGGRAHRPSRPGAQALQVLPRPPHLVTAAGCRRRHLTPPAEMGDPHPSPTHMLTPTLTLTHKGASCSSRQGPTTQLLSPIRAFTFLIIAGHLRGCLGQGWSQSERPRGAGRRPPTASSRQSLWSEDHSDRMYVLAPHRGSQTERQVGGQVGGRLCHGCWAHMAGL